MAKHKSLIPKAFPTMYLEEGAELVKQTRAEYSKKGWSTARESFNQDVARALNKRGLYSFQGPWNGKKARELMDAILEVPHLSGCLL